MQFLVASRCLPQNDNKDNNNNNNQSIKENDVKNYLKGVNY